MTLITKRRLVASPALALVALVGFASVASAATPGSWTAYPGQTSTNEVKVQAPINADGTSNFKADKGVIPVKFGLYTSAGPFAFESIGSGYSYVSYTPAAPLALGDLTELKANYNFTTGENNGGAMRWQIRTGPSQAIFVYYGAAPNFTGTAADQSGANMLAMDDLRFDTSQYSGGTFYDTWAHAKSLAGEATPISRVSLMLDGGWKGDQVVDLTSATVNGNTFTPAPAPAMSPTSDLPAATIKIEKTSGAATGAVNEPVTIQPKDSDGAFRIVDSKYMYNLDVKSLSGAGHYKVEVVIGGTTVAGGAEFDLR